MKSPLTIPDKYWHFVNLSYCKTYVRGLFRTQSNIYNKAFLRFLQRSSTIDARLGSKYASAYIYIQLSPIEIICILNIFSVKNTFSDKRRMKQSSSKRIKRNFLSLYFILAYSCSRCMIHSQTYFLPPGATKGFKRNRNSPYNIVRKIVSLKIQANPLMSLWWSLFYAKLHLSNLLILLKTSIIPGQRQEFFLYFKSAN